MSKSIAMQALRHDLSRIVGEVAYGDQTYVIDSYGRPAAVLISVQHFERLTSISVGRASETPPRIASPRLVDAAAAADFEMDVTGG